MKKTLFDFFFSFFSLKPSKCLRFSKHSRLHWNEVASRHPVTDYLSLAACPKGVKSLHLPMLFYLQMIICIQLGFSLFFLSIEFNKRGKGSLSFGSHWTLLPELLNESEEFTIWKFSLLNHVCWNSCWSLVLDYAARPPRDILKISDYYRNSNVLDKAHIY